MLAKILKRLWAGYFYFSFAYAFLFFLPFMWLCIWMGKLSVYHVLRRWGCKYVLFITGIWYTVRYDYPLEKDQTYIFCPNHTSLLDILIPIAAIHRQFRFVGKEELGRIPLFGPVFRKVDIAIVRSEKMKALEALDRAAELLEEGIDIFIYPEGTTSGRAPKILAFKKGPFKLAVEKQIPIVPITFADNWRLAHYHVPWMIRPGISRVVIHPPIYPQSNDVAGEREMSARVFDALENGLVEFWGNRAKVGTA